ncbi:MAG TPA: TIGR03086 family metal-binding protein [Acidimicrobiia bacterium]|nr:TIGR03086 family metal-binding protein [Acidimicrobiia bacterium]
MDTEEQLETAIATLRTVVAGIEPGQLDNPTPCANFDVRTLLGHFLGNLESVAGGLRGRPMPAELAPRPDLVGDDPVKAYDAVMADFVAAVRSPGAMDRVLTVPFGEVPAPALVGFVAFDLVVHGWDLATATGQRYEPPDELVAEVDAFARQVVAPEWRDGDTFAAEVEPRSGAAPVERLVAFSGRQP